MLKPKITDPNGRPRLHLTGSVDLKRAVTIVIATLLVVIGILCFAWILVL